jgi:serine-type D-Ala-D-Ala carboxypeptidase (penicillin-binding protein 5/6)
MLTPERRLAGPAQVPVHDSPPRVAIVPPRRRWAWPIGAAAAVSVLGVAAVLAGLSTPGPTPVAAPASPAVTLTVPASYTIPGTPPVLPWPAQGQAVVEVVGTGRLGSSGVAKPAPIASVAKVMTAYVVLADHPLTPGTEGPTLTVSPSEAAAYPTQLAANQSLVKVTAGEVLTERQALTALLLPSADNVAQILARWDAGGAAAFVARMNATAARLGMADTRYTDPSGLDRATVSTAADQVKLAEQAMAVPALAELVALPRATIPVAGMVTNYNTLLGQDGIVGVKTGSTVAAGGCLVFAARFSAGGRDLLLIGAVLGQPGPLWTLLPSVLDASRKLVRAATAAVAPHVLVPAGAVVGERGAARLVTTEDLTVPGWPGLAVPVTAHVHEDGTGSLDAGGGSVPVAAVG